MRKVWNPFARFWQAEKSLSVLLGLLIVSELILPALLPGRGPRDPVTGAFFSCILVAGAAAVWRRHAPWAARVVGALCLLAVLAWWAAWFDPRGTLTLWRPATNAVTLALLALMVLASVLRAGTITRNQIEGAIAAYLLLGLAWAGAYELVALRDPSAFVGLGASGGLQWTYYSLVTLTTMGYGDITPVAPAARSLAVAEALTGQMYVAILISRLVALSLQTKK